MTRSQFDGPDPARPARPDGGPRAAGPGPVRVLVIDDSPTLRRLIRLRLAADPRLQVVGEACDPIEAREGIRALSPDVITLDVEMPRMSGLDFLERLMRLRPMPVVMVSSETGPGSAAAIEALALGAVDCVGKPALNLQDGFADLPDRLVAAARARLRLPGETRTAVPPPAGYHSDGRILLIGASTGGVDALETVLGSFPADCPPTLVTQHMPEAFLASFAQRLDQIVAPRVRLGADGAPLLPGTVHLAPGGAHHLALRPGHPPLCQLSDAPRCNGHRPSVEVMFDSALPIASRCIAVLLTGMGRDGAEALSRLRRAGARCLAQDEASSVVWGMPRAAMEIGAAERALPLGRIGPELLAMTGQSCAPRRSL
ncbi:protein-glutamate methylesterase/protein-glutamine glutaminase [Frigidibacter oleivorans]|uniref:protein-glutamate methylesterase/protein-glutamine glutaminase n=1 Tax=Frigidibacter oleivorans TaxID=2487129 RepID=UPI000F8EC8B1|nr:chemotaxis response regulator protein-glutamate methylesterase [Frigidibacter oleivorans]